MGGDATSNGVFSGDNPLNSSVGLLIVQLFVIVALSRVMAYLLKPLKQPRVVAEIIGGILLGPSALGRIPKFSETLFPSSSMLVLSTFANFGLIFFLFLVGLELDLNTLKDTAKKAIAISISGMILPFGLGTVASYVIYNTHSVSSDFGKFLLFMGVAMSITAFPVLARILTEHKLLNTDLGQMAMSAAAVDDVAAWCLLALTIALLKANSSPITALFTFLCAIGFIVTMFLVVRPLAQKAIVRFSVADEVSPLIVLMIFGMVLGASFMTDFIGIHGIFGAFIVGLIVPKNPGFTHSITEKIEDMVLQLLLPPYFAISGIKTNIGMVTDGLTVGLLVLVIFCACCGKVVGCYVTGSCLGVPKRQALTLAVLMNTKGLVEVIVLNIGLAQGVINVRIFTIMILMALFTTFVTSPLVLLLHEKEIAKPSAKSKESKNQLRILTCVTGMRSVMSSINFLDLIMNSSKHKPLKVYCLHLLELSERPSAFLMLHGSKNKFSKNKNHQDPVGMAFKSFANLKRLSAKSLISVSSPDDMHEDVLFLSAHKQVDLIVMPFQITTLANSILDISSTNKATLNVLSQTDSTVLVLVDTPSINNEQNESKFAQESIYTIMAIFFGGPDDREALAMGMKMCEKPNSRFVVVHIYKEGEDLSPHPNTEEEEVTVDIPSPLIYSMHMRDLQINQYSESEKDKFALSYVKKLLKNRTDIISKVVTDSSILLQSVVEVVSSFQHDIIVLGRNLKYVPNLIQPIIVSSTSLTAHTLGPVGEALMKSGVGRNTGQVLPINIEKRTQSGIMLVVQQGGVHTILQPQPNLVPSFREKLTISFKGLQMSYRGHPSVDLSNVENPEHIYTMETAVIDSPPISPDVSPRANPPFLQNTSGSFKGYQLETANT